MIQHLTEASTIRIGPAQLASIAARIAAEPQSWQELLRYDPATRWYCRLALTDRYEVWLLSWLPGQQTGFHDHGPSAGAFSIAAGRLTERSAAGGRPAARTSILVPGSAKSFGPDYVHDVRNETAEPAVSVHAYSPPLTSMRRFGLGPDGTLRVTELERSW